MGEMNTLHEIALEYANKQPGMVDALTEDSPVLDRMKWIASTHGLWNIAEKLTEITGAGFVEADAPLPLMGASSDLTRTDLCVMGGKIVVPTLQAIKFGGPAAYFARKQNSILRENGQKIEKQIILKNWLEAAKQEKNIRSAGGTGQGYFLLAVRFDELANIGLYDPDQFVSGRFFRIDPVNGGAEFELNAPGLMGVPGYAVMYRAIFGWQMLDARRTVSAIVNIQEGKVPTTMQIDDMLADVRANPSNTIIITSPRARILGLMPHKQDYLQVANGETNLNTIINFWNGIPVINTYNLVEPIENIKASK